MPDYFRVLLLQAPVPGPHNRLVVKSSAIPPLGLGYLAAVLLEENFEVRISDMDIEDLGVEPLCRLLSSFEPGIIGISTTTLTFKSGLRVAKIAKEVSPQAFICMGGPHATVLPHDALTHPFVDAVVQGEGEISFLEICRKIADGHRPPIEIQGTVQRHQGGIRSFLARPRIQNLDCLPFPARHLMPLHLYKIPGTMVTSRGCPFTCGFCAGPAVLGRQYTVRSAASVVAEVKTCINLFGLTSFYFVDDTMTANRSRVFEICELLRGVNVPPTLGRQLKWTCESRADIVTREMLQEMRSAGCTTIQFGMESGSQELLDELGKKITLKQIEQAVTWSRDVGISPVLSMVFPHPSETPESLQKTLSFIQKLYDLGAEKVVPALLTLFPGTRFMEQRKKLGLRLLTEDTDEYNLGTPTIETRNFDRDQIAQGYSELLSLTLSLGGDEIGGIAINLPQEAGKLVSRR